MRGHNAQGKTRIELHTAHFISIFLVVILDIQSAGRSCSIIFERLLVLSVVDGVEGFHDRRRARIEEWWRRRGRWRSAKRVANNRHRHRSEAD
jgi:hypothetical protein